MSAMTIIAAPPAMPEMPAELAQKCASFDGMDLIRGSVPAVVVDQAKRHLAALEAYHRPAPEALVTFWFRRLRAGMTPITEEDFLGRMEAVRAVCGDLPGWIWTAEAHKAAWKRFKFFPTAHEAFELLDAIAQRGMRGMYHVRALAGANPASADAD